MLIQSMQWLMAGLFALSAALQLNDPDPALWVLLYAGAALICLMAALRKPLRMAGAALAAVTLGWALALAPRVIGEVSFFELFSDIHMKSEAVELGREMGGLLIVALWMLVTVWLDQYRARDNADERP